MAVYFTSDLHFGHNREFLWGVRGFDSSEEHDIAIIENWNNMITDEDDVYILGDLMLGDNAAGIEKIKQLKGQIHVILGNHDTANRVALYHSCDNIVDIAYANAIKYNGWHFYLSHYPTMTCNLEKEFGKHCLLNLYGHTHQNQSNFYNGLPFCYHVGLDSHNCKPILVDDIIEDIKKEVKMCEYYL